MKRFVWLLAVLTVVGLFVRLGFWQLSRAQERQELVDRNAHAGDLAPLDALPVASDWEVLRYRRIALAGGYDVAHQLLIDNQVYNSRAGYHVVTPYRTAGASCSVLVNRGWVEAGTDRHRLPTVNVQEPGAPVAGVLDRLPTLGWKLQGGDKPSGANPARVQWLEPNVLAEWTGGCVLPYLIRLSPDSPEGYVRDWQLEAINPDKNRAYAFQWFALALAFAGYSGWRVWRSTRR